MLLSYFLRGSILSPTPIEPIAYEQRIICFFDILGWKEHVKKAGDNPEEIEKLAFLPKLLNSDEVKAMNSSSSRLTSFSDCAVVSFLVEEVDFKTFIGGLSQVFLGAAVNGFFSGLVSRLVMFVIKKIWFLGLHLIGLLS
ncbi:hypothetical protein PYV50_08655 [Pseudomonas sp. H22_DOA]|nr:hypothetical protein PYV50_08655 [Pseudomonas sp. H22_DOA]